jgi:hypothetical protein
MAIFKTIPKKFIGKKEIVKGDVTLLNGFRFTSTRPLDSLLKKRALIHLLPTGKLHIALPAGMPVNLFKKVPKAQATAVQLHLYNMDLIGNEDEIIPINQLFIPFNNDFRGAELNIPLNLAGHRLLLVAMGVHYFGERGEIGAKRTKAAEIIFAGHFKNGIQVQFIPTKETAVPEVAQAEGLSWDLG